MDALTIIGLLIGFLAIIIGQMLEGGELASLMNLPALLIVMGGTLGAVMIQTPYAVFKDAIKIFPWIFKPPAMMYEQSKQKIIELARRARQFGLLSLEQHLEIEDDPLFAKGLELLVMGVDKQTIRFVMEAEIIQMEERNNQAAAVYESMGGYSPTIGILGAVIGLIQVMQNLADPEHLGTGIAVAFVATIYGVGLANLLFLPIANKIKSYNAMKTQFEEMQLEGLVAIASGESPNVLNLKLDNYGPKISNETKEKSDKPQ